MKDVCLLVGKRIRYWRKFRGYTQIELADFCNTSKNNLSDIECGKHFPSFELAIRLNFALCVNFKDLYVDALDYLSIDHNKKCYIRYIQINNILSF